MPDLSIIPGIDPAARQLFEVIGYDELHQLADIEPAKLRAKLQHANDLLHILPESPAQEDVEGWVREARKQLARDHALAEKGSPSPEPVAPSNFEMTPELRSYLSRAPLAIPLPAKLLVEHKLPVSDILEAILPSKHQGDLDFRIEAYLPPGKRKPDTASHAAPPKSRREAIRPKGVLDIDTSKVREFGEGKADLPVNFVTAREDERKQKLLTTKPETNRGRERGSRWYIRGVLHNRPYTIYFGALVTALTIVLAPLAFIATVLLLLKDSDIPSLGWVPDWLLAFPIVLLVACLCWAAMSFQCSCRVCGQKLFMHRTHRKNAKAHRLPLLGYVLPLCLHILLFRWFRCTHCGTPIRLKE